LICIYLKLFRLLNNIFQANQYIITLLWAFELWGILNYILNFCYKVELLLNLIFMLQNFFFQSISIQLLVLISVISQLILQLLLFFFQLAVLFCEQISLFLKFELKIFLLIFVQVNVAFCLQVSFKYNASLF